VARLDAYTRKNWYRLRYTGGAKRARSEAGFPLLAEFPDLLRDYQSPRLFALFRNRIINRRRPDRAEYLRTLDLDQRADPLEILAASGGRRMTDSYQVFPKILKGPDGRFRCRFFLHGWRHTNIESQRRIDRLVDGEPLGVALELTNPVVPIAAQLHTEDYHMIGWAPRFLAVDLAQAIVSHPDEYSVNAVKLNPLPAPSRQRVLIEMKGRWGDYDPMEGPDCQPLIAD